MGAGVCRTGEGREAGAGDRAARRGSGPQRLPAELPAENGMVAEEVVAHRDEGEGVRGEHRPLEPNAPLWRVRHFSSTRPPIAPCTTIVASR